MEAGNGERVLAAEIEPQSCTHVSSGRKQSGVRPGKLAGDSNLYVQD